MRWLIGLVQAGQSHHSAGNSQGGDFRASSKAKIEQKKEAAQATVPAATTAETLGENDDGQEQAETAEDAAATSAEVLGENDNGQELADMRAKLLTKAELPALAQESAIREEVVAHSRLRSVAMSDMLGKLSEPSQEPEQDSQNNFGTNGGTGGSSCDSSKTTNTDVGIGKHTFNQEAVDFVPGQVWQGTVGPKQGVEGDLDASMNRLAAVFDSLKETDAAAERRVTGEGPDPRAREDAGHLGISPAAIDKVYDVFACWASDDANDLTTRAMAAIENDIVSGLQYELWNSWVEGRAAEWLSYWKAANEAGLELTSRSSGPSRSKAAGSAHASRPGG